MRKTPVMRLCLNMIVKNESARIVRALESTVNHISCAVIVDTGSTDDTVKVIRDFFVAKNIPCIVGSAPFIDWSNARNAALMAARSAAMSPAFEWDYLLLMDADMELRVHDPKWMDRRTGPAWDMYQTAGALTYQNRRLVHKDELGLYKGVTHEYLNVLSAGLIPRADAEFIDHADGSNRPDKYRRDIKLLKQGLKDEPNNERYMYYLAQSYRDAGKPSDAAKWYKRRIAAGGWNEEVWSAQQCYAYCLRDLGDEAGFIRETLVAYNMRPSRAETLFDLAKNYRDKGENAASVIFSEAGINIPLSTDALFVNDYVYQCGIKDEFSICAYYLPDKRERGFDICNELALKKGPYGFSRELARSNLLYYIKPLKEVAPSWEWKKLDFKAEPNWTAMNPSVTVHEDILYAVIRTVNYNLENGRYFIAGNPLGPLNDDNPIRTRNFLTCLRDDFSILSAGEILPPSNMPAPLFKPVLGFEDMRLFSWKDQLWTSSTVREMNAGGVCEQVLAPLQCESGEQWFVDDNWKRMLRMPQEYEKNWAPVSTPLGISFMYRPGEVVNTDGETAIKHEPEQDIRHFSGGSQLIEFREGWLAIIHEARFLPGTQNRYYSHRFIMYGSAFDVLRISKPFVFNDKVIEFCAGMCWHPVHSDRIVISYGFKDAEARIGTISAKDVEKMLWQKPK